MIIDAHHHLWRYDPAQYDWIGPEMSAIARDFGPGDLVATMIANGVDYSVAVQARQSEAETRWLMELARTEARIAGVVGWVDLEADDLDARLNAYAGEPKLTGFRHVLQGEPDDAHVLRPDFMRGLETLARRGYRYDVLVFERQLPGVVRMMERLPELPCVIDHIAKPDMSPTPSAHWTDHMRAIAANSAACCKLSGMVTEADWSDWSYDTFAPYLDVLFHAFGPERLMFGSDWPVCLVAGSYARVKSVVAQFIDTHCPDDAAAIWGGTAQRFYGLDVSPSL